MKKLFFLTLSIAVCSNIFANLTQGDWRWRNNDGSETSATWKAAMNTPFLMTSTNQVMRLRYDLRTPSSSYMIFPISENLQYATSVYGPWITITTTPGTNAFVMANVSNYVEQDEPTTNQLTTVSNYIPGKVMVSNNNAMLPYMAASKLTELEWAITGTSNTLSEATYYFRDYSMGNGMNYNSYPTLFTANVLPVKISSFTARREENKVRIDWVTSSEQNNDRFDIQRSSDATTWKTISMVKGHGNSSATNAYNVYDESPLSGINYYVIRQYDFDGHSKLSAMKTINMPADVKTIISVYPNPSTDGVNFSIVNKGASNVEVVLGNISGNIIHKEIFKSVAANAINKLHLSYQPAPGVYILKINAAGLSETARIIIE